MVWIYCVNIEFELFIKRTIFFNHWAAVGTAYLDYDSETIGIALRFQYAGREEECLCPMRIENYYGPKNTGIRESCMYNVQKNIDIEI